MWIVFKWVKTGFGVQHQLTDCPFWKKMIRNKPSKFKLSAWRPLKFLHSSANIVIQNFNVYFHSDELWICTTCKWHLRFQCLLTMKVQGKGRQGERKREEERPKERSRVTTYSHHDALTPNIYLWYIVHSAIPFFKCLKNNKRYI